MRSRHTPSGVAPRSLTPAAVVLPLCPQHEAEEIRRLLKNFPKYPEQEEMSPADLASQIQDAKSKYNQEIGDYLLEFATNLNKSAMPERKQTMRCVWSVGIMI